MWLKCQGTIYALLVSENRGAIIGEFMVSHFNYLATHTAHTACILLPSLVSPHVFFEVIGSMEGSVWTDWTGVGPTKVTSGNNNRQVLLTMITSSSKKGM